MHKKRIHMAFENSALDRYLKEYAGVINPAMTAYVANLQLTAEVAPEIAADVVKELDADYLISTGSL